MQLHSYNTEFNNFPCQFKLQNDSLRAGETYNNSID